MPEDDKTTKPTYFAQAKPDFIKQHGDRLAKHGPELQNALEATIRLEDENTALQQKLARAIIVPNADKPDPEEVKEFKAKMALPDNAEGYQFTLSEDAKKLEGIADVSRAIAAAAFDGAMTKPQAQKFHDFVVGRVLEGQRVRASAQKEAADKFSERLAVLFNGDAKRTEAAINLYKAALKRMSESSKDSDFVPRLLRSGMFYEPVFAAQIALTEQHMGDHEFIDDGGGGGKGGGEKRGSMGSYSPQFQQEFGKQGG